MNTRNAAHTDNNNPGSPANILNLEHVSLNYGVRQILDDVTVGISSRDRIGVIGINGQGKSTLLKIAAGVLEPDEGRVTKMNGLRIAYLPQNPVFDNSLSLQDNIASRISGREAHWNIEGEARATMQRFGITDPSCSPATLSGGQKKRAALAAAMLTPSDLLILDEPTNHLDSGMIEYLQTWLSNYKGAILMVTHDRYFLDEVTNGILEIDRGRVYRYEAGYSGYLELKQQRLDYAKAAERKMAALYRQDLAWMMRGARARSTKQKAHIRRFEALRDRDKIVEDREVMLSSLPSRIGGKTIELSSISKSYAGHVLFHDFSYIFRKTDRLGIIGPNGCGKSTLLRVILGIIPPDTGTVEVGQTIQFGYFSQENEEMDHALEEEPTLRVIDYIRKTAEYIRTPEGLVSASEMCDRFLFDPKMQYTQVSRLSGGEKRRLYLLHVLMANPNVLILDEPTNDLDIQTLQILEDYLDHFAGIVIAVSHDRYFLDRVVTRIFAFEPDGTLWQSEGGYEEYREHRRALAVRNPGLSTPRRVPLASNAPFSRSLLSTSDTRNSRKGSPASNAPSSREGSPLPDTSPSRKVPLPSGSGSLQSGHAAPSVDSGNGNTKSRNSGSSARPASDSMPARSASDGRPADGNIGSADHNDNSASRHRAKLSYKDQREYDSLEPEIDRLTAESKDLEQQMAAAATDYQKLAELTEQKNAVDEQLDRKMERFLELQDLIDSLQDG